MNDVIYNHDLIQDSDNQSYVIPRPKSSYSYNSRSVSQLDNKIEYNSIDEHNNITNRSSGTNIIFNHNFEEDKKNYYQLKSNKD